MTWIIEAQPIKIIKPPALIYQDKKPPRISSYGRLKLYRGK